jgi:hypothetical protein
LKIEPKIISVLGWCTAATLLTPGRAKEHIEKIANASPSCTSKKWILGHTFGRSELIKTRPLFGVRKNFVSSGDFFKLLF